MDPMEWIYILFNITPVCLQQSWVVNTPQQQGSHGSRGLCSTLVLHQYYQTLGLEHSPVFQHYNSLYLDVPSKSHVGHTVFSEVAKLECMIDWWCNFQVKNVGIMDANAAPTLQHTV